MGLSIYCLAMSILIKMVVLWDKNVGNVSCFARVIEKSYMLRVIEKSYMLRFDLISTICNIHCEEIRSKANDAQP